MLESHFSITVVEWSHWLVILFIPAKIHKASGAFSPFKSGTKWKTRVQPWKWNFQVQAWTETEREVQSCPSARTHWTLCVLPPRSAETFVW